MVEVMDRHQDAIDDVIRDAVRGSGKVNIIVAGKTGVGKSTLINCVFRGHLAKTGSGQPVTQQIEEISKEGHPITIVDSKGLELKDYQQILSDLDGFLVERADHHDENKHIHAAWICIQEGGDRIEQAEIDLCQLLIGKSIPVVAVVTKSMFGKDMEFHKKVKELLPGARAVVRVRAQTQEFEDDDGNLIKLKEKGVDELIYESARLIPEAKKRAFANALSSRHQSSMKIKIEQAEKEVLIASGLAAAAGATPIPFSDSFVLVPIQVGMLAKIGVTFGMEVSTSALTTLVASALGSSAASLLGRAVVTGLLKMIPGVGSAVGGTIAATTAATLTKGLGAAYISVLTDFCNNNPGKELNISLIGDELKRKLSLK
ncbi:50S ribosome-binding GTPase [Pseudomonas sp. P66]|uniref:50S ribosome-binding GTPase n=1 Tax=Pseudomonas arcuscaelestis TaxID=2710591 RepID=A0ABS2BXM2_9PSED|nr:GTPase [Pseudomonas arcuscaelestis]MBM5458195.1 50S ribosome-binding GTPase [Pseudomonas arcuscaelestis]